MLITIMNAIPPVIVPDFITNKKMNALPNKNDLTSSSFLTYNYHFLASERAEMIMTGFKLTSG